MVLARLGEPGDPYSSRRISTVFWSKILEGQPLRLADDLAPVLDRYSFGGPRPRPRSGRRALDDERAGRSASGTCRRLGDRRRPARPRPRPPRAGRPVSVGLAPSPRHRMPRPVLCRCAHLARSQSGEVARPPLGFGLEPPAAITTHGREIAKAGRRAHLTPVTRPPRPGSACAHASSATSTPAASARSRSIWTRPVAAHRST